MKKISENSHNNNSTPSFPPRIPAQEGKTQGNGCRAFCIAFLALFFIFIYHSSHFMFGDHDWKFLKHGISLSAGLFEGRYSQFLLINLLSAGDILPVINNIIGFIGFALGIVLLAKYWRLPQKSPAFTVFVLATAVTPYILSFMYFAFLVIPILWWNVFIIGALIISESEKTFSLKKTLSATLCLTLALGGYPPVINLIATAFTARLLIAVTEQKHSLKELFKNYRYTAINIILALFFYILSLYILRKYSLINNNYYNLQTIPFSEYAAKTLLVLKDTLRQFTATLPFIGLSTKITQSALVIIAFISILSDKRLSITRRFAAVLLFISIYVAGLITLFLSTSINEAEFSPRIDFFGLMYGFSAALAVILKSPRKFFKNIGYALALISICHATATLSEAQKVWDLGFKAEMRLYKRIGKRFQSDPLFSLNNHYIIVQSGTPSLRNKYYHEAYQYPSDDLLNISFVPGMASGVMWNYSAPKEYADTKSYVYTFKPDEKIRQDLKNAEPWPSEKSISVGGYWILLPLTAEGLAHLRHTFLPR